MTEIPEAAITAAAEVLARETRNGFGEYTADSDWRELAGIVREVLAAALPHLGDPMSRAMARGAAMADEVLARHAARKADHG